MVYRSSVGGLSVDCLIIKSLDFQCQIYNLYALCLDHVRKFSRYQARNLSEIMPNTENTKKKAEKRISIKKEAGRRFFLLFIISYGMLSLHIITFPQDTLELLGQIINKTKHQILIRHKFV